MEHKKHIAFLLIFIFFLGILTALIYNEPKKAHAVFLPQMFEKPDQELLYLAVLNPDFGREVSFTDKREVILEIKVGPKVRALAFADSDDFSSSAIEKLEKLESKKKNSKIVYLKEWRLPEEFGEYEVCAKAYTHFGQPSQVFCNGIEYAEQLPDELLEEKIARQRGEERKQKEEELRRKRAIKILQNIILLLPPEILEILPPEVLDGLPPETLQKIAQKIIEFHQEPQPEEEEQEEEPKPEPEEEHIKTEFHFH